MTTLDPWARHLTLTNTFTVAPDRADESALLSKVTQETIRFMPGFISANLHVSRDRCHITNYALWRSQADMTAMLGNPASQVHLREAAAVALSFSPIV